MTLTPLFNASPAIQLHVYTVVPAAVLGMVQLVSSKGTPVHRILGAVFMVLTLIAASAALFIPSFTGGFIGHHFGPIHLLIPLTFFTVPYAVLTARSGNIKAHKTSMLGLYIGAIGIAGIFAFAPGRVMHAIVFGE